MKQSKGVKAILWIAAKAKQLRRKHKGMSQKDAVSTASALYRRRHHKK